MTKKIIWRMGKLPSVEELRELVKDKIITNEEAREILFNHEEVDERDSKSLKEEIKFLRDLVERLSHHNNSLIIKEIKVIKEPYKSPWIQPYITWCDGAIYTTTTATTANNYLNCSETGYETPALNFTAIQTF